MPSRLVHPEQLKAWMTAEGITGMDAESERPLPPPTPAEDAATPLIVRLERLEARLAEQAARLSALEASMAALVGGAECYQPSRAIPLALIQQQVERYGKPGQQPLIVFPPDHEQAARLSAVEAWIASRGKG